MRAIRALPGIRTEAMFAGFVAGMLVLYSPVMYSNLVVST
jgi:hypothetical protein